LVRLLSKSALTPRRACITLGACISARPVDSEVLTHYVVVRTDLPVGIIAAQVVHAAGESSPGQLPDGTFAVVLAAPSEGSLSDIACRLTVAGVPHVQVREPDAPYCGQLMAVGLEPAPRWVGRRWLSGVPLFRGSTHAGVAQSRAPVEVRQEVDGSRPSPGTTRVHGSEVEHPE
jgi:hypothetical protein